MIDYTEIEQDYKEIFIPMKSELNARDKYVLGNVFAKFPENELTYDLSDGGFTLFLNTIDCAII